MGDRAEPFVSLEIYFKITVSVVLVVPLKFIFCC